jgi:uncharacterized repeat protein (TIGR03803 family)
MDPSGNLFGTNSAGVFELRRSSGGWTEQVIYQPQYYARLVTGLTLDATGNNFGVGYSSAFELSPNGNGGWTPTVLHTFMTRYFLGPNPVGAPVIDKAGNFYGATYRGGANKFGTIYKITFRNGKWREKALYSFTGEILLRGSCSMRPGTFTALRSAAARTTMNCFRASRPGWQEQLP